MECVAYAGRHNMDSVKVDFLPEKDRKRRIMNDGSDLKM